MKNKILPFIKDACGICVFISFLFFLFAKLIFIGRSDTTELGIAFSQYLLFFLFSLVIRGAGCIFGTKLPKLLQVLIHYTLTGVSLFIICILASKISLDSFAKMFGAFCFYTLIYALCLAVLLLFGKIKQKRKGTENKDTYENRFSL
ncbi:MAG: DUF3021 family protein [Clostridia bacterium]|nr:DUF3021 family protein [Clostridia bacterium]